MWAWRLNRNVEVEHNAAGCATNRKLAWLQSVRLRTAVSAAEDGHKRVWLFIHRAHAFALSVHALLLTNPETDEAPE